MESDLRELSLLFLYKAEEDLKDSNILFNKKSYANSFFHLQQSVKKQLKAYGLYTDIIHTKKELRKYDMKVIV